MFIYYKCYIIDRVGISEGIDVNKTSVSKECDKCHYQYFLNYSFQFQTNFWNWCHDLVMMSINHSDMAILNIKGSDYWFIINLIRNETVNVVQNVDLTKKAEHKT